MGNHHVFPAAKLSVDPRSGLTRRHHADDSNLQRAVRCAAQRAQLSKSVSPTSSATPSPPTSSTAAPPQCAAPWMCEASANLPSSPPL